MKNKRGLRMWSAMLASAGTVLAFVIASFLIAAPASADDGTTPTDTPISVVSTSDPSQQPAVTTDDSTTAPDTPAPDPTQSTAPTDDSTTAPVPAPDFVAAATIQAAATGLPSPQTFVVNAWKIGPLSTPSNFDASTLNGTTAFKDDQTDFKTSAADTSVNLNVLDSQLVAGACYQVDGYKVGDITTALLAEGPGVAKLHGPNSPAEDLAYGAPGLNGGDPWKFVCIPPAPITCTVNGPAYTESGDHIPTPLAAGVDYRSYHDGHATGTVIPVSGNAQGIVNLSFTDTNVVGNGMFSRLIFNLSANGGPSYASFSVSPGNSITQTSVAGVGSNSHVLGLTIAQVATAYPLNTYTGYAFQTGSSYPGDGGPTSDGATLTGYAGDCGTVNYVAPDAIFPDGSQTCNTFTLPSLYSYEKYPLDGDGNRYTAGTHPLVGTVTIVAHTLASDTTHQQGSKTYTFTAYDCPLTKVTPVTPEVTCNTDTNTPNPGLTFAEIQALQPTGVHTTDNGDGTVSFSAEDGYVLTDGSATTYSLALSDLACAIGGADASVSVAVAVKCDVTGVASVTPTHSHPTLSAPLDQTVGTHDVSYTADAGYKFDDGSDFGSLTRILSYTIPPATTCGGTLALTGVDGPTPLGWFLIFLMFASGIAAVVWATRRNRTAPIVAD